MALDAGHLTVTLLMMLDLTAAFIIIIIIISFDCVDHDTLLQRLKKSYRLTGLALDWFISSYVTGRT